MEEYFKILGSGNVGIYVGIALAVIVFGLAVARGVMRTRGNVEKQDSHRVDKQSVEPQHESAATSVKEDGETLDGLLYNGEYKCMCFRPGNILDFTSMRKTIGEAYQFDGSLPVSGSAYIVMQNAKGEVIDYDPRDEEFKKKQSPEYLWIATHPQRITKQFWTAPIQWWKSTSTWFAAAMIAVTFICALVVFE